MKTSRQEIVQLAGKLVAQKGFDSFSYADLSEVLGIKKASLHHHFPKKEDLGLAVMEAILEGGKGQFETIWNASSDASEQLDLYLDMVRKNALAGASICPVSSLQAEMEVIPESMCERLREIGEVEIDFLTKILASGKRQGVFHFKAEPRAAAATLLSAIKGALQYSRPHGSGFFEQVSGALTSWIK